MRRSSGSPGSGRIAQGGGDPKGRGAAPAPIGMQGLHQFPADPFEDAVHQLSLEDPDPFQPQGPADPIDEDIGPGGLGKPQDADGDPGAHQEAHQGFRQAVHEMPR